MTPTKEQTMLEANELRERAFAIISDNSKADEFNGLMARLEIVTKIASTNGWLPYFKELGYQVDGKKRRICT